MRGLAFVGDNCYKYLMGGRVERGVCLEWEVRVFFV